MLGIVLDLEMSQLTGRHAEFRATKSGNDWLINVSALLFAVGVGFVMFFLSGRL